MKLLGLKQSKPEALLAFHIRAHKLPEPEREFRFHPVRKFRFDFSWPAQLVAVEIQGGTWIKGAHSTGQGIARDCMKFSLAASLGWRVLPVTTDMVNKGEAISLIVAALLAQPNFGTAHTDHGARHWDRTCAGCLAEAALSPEFAP